MLSLPLMLLLVAGPRVVSTTPAGGDALVDPALGAIRVEFDRDMTLDSYSWVGGGPSFPRTAGAPRWIGPRVNELPVTLEPDHLYAVGINGGRFTGFRDVDGAAAEPVLLTFATAGADPRAVDPEAAAEAARRLREIIEGFYSYRDRRGLDWPGLFADHGPALASSPTPAAFALRTWSLLRPTQDMHIAVEYGGARIGLPLPTVEPNFDGRALGHALDVVQRHNDVVVSGRAADGIGYLLIATWDRARAADIAAAHAALDELLDAPALVIDVRVNGGGDESIAAEMAGRFVDEPVVYARHEVCDPSAAGGFSPAVARVLQPSNRRAYEGRSCVLMGPANASSAEAFLLMMRQVPSCTLVGARSRGSSGNPRPHPLGNGVIVHLPSWRAMDAQGCLFEGTGLRPDVEVLDSPTPLLDPVLARALEILRAPPEG